MAQRVSAARLLAPRTLSQRSCVCGVRCRAQLAAVHEVQAHSTSVLALASHVDARLGVFLASTSADGSLAIWRCTSPGGPLQLHSRHQLIGAPLFSLISNAGWLLAGTAAKDVLRLQWSELVSDAASLRVERAGTRHTGWVRALVTDGCCVFSVGCNFVRCWDAATLAPLGQERLFSGDVSALACLGGVTFSGGADGSLRAYEVDAARRPAVRLRRTIDQAHSGRVEALTTCAAMVISGGRDGALRVWHPAGLALAHEVLNAHCANSRVQCLAACDDGVLLSGGSDGCVRRWQCVPGSGILTLAGVGAASSPVRSLLSLSNAQRARVVVVSGHQDGAIRVSL